MGYAQGVAAFRRYPFMRILFIHATPVPPPKDKSTDRFFLLSKTLEGDVIQPIWFARPEEVEAELGPGSYPVYESGRFRYHWFLWRRLDGQPRPHLAQFWFFIRKGVEIYRQRPFDCMVVYAHLMTGVAAACVKLLTRARLIIEVVTMPELSYLTERPVPTLRDRLRKLYSDVCLHLSLRAADRAHLLYTTQLDAYPSLRGMRTSVFHDFVPVSKIGAHVDGGEKYVLMVGSPWYLKGADRLIEAFQRLAPDFPDVKLKIVGWYDPAEREQLERLAGGSKQIELVRAVSNPIALEMMRRCLVSVLPSRREGLPRVVIEGLAAGAPVIGSDAGGTSEIIQDGESGFVVPGENIEELEERLRQLLADPDLRQRMGERGREFAHTRLTEEVYVEKFTAMVAATVEGSR